MVKPFNFLGEENSKTRRKASQKQEDRWAKKTGGRTQAGSGAVWSSKGDVKAGSNIFDEPLSFLYENKQTEHASFRLSAELWNEIRDKAHLTEGRLPAMQIELERKSPSPTRLVVLEEADYLELLERAQNLQK